MTRSFSVSLKRPQDTLRLPLPAARKLVDIGRGWWIGCFALVILFCIGVYLYEVSQSASKGFVMRDLQIRTENLQDNVDVLQRQYASMESLSALQARLSGLQYVPIDHVEYVGSPSVAYAVK